ITLVMSAVFIPVAFLPGPVGVFYRQFSLTLAIAIAISGVNALTLTPALCAILLRESDTERKKNNFLQRFFDAFNKAYDTVAGSYKNAVAAVAGRKMVTLALLVSFFAATWGINRVLPTGFIPNEDQGVVYINVTAPSGATVERTERVLNQIQKVAAGMDIVEATSTLAGYSLVNGVSGASFGMGIVNLKPWDERRHSVNEVIKILEERTKGITDADVEFFSPPTVPGFGNSSGFEIRVLDKTGRGDMQELETVTKNFITALAGSPAIDQAHTNYDPNFPQYMIHVDQDMAAKKGITIEQAMGTLQTLMGGNYTSNFVRFGQMYRVMVQAAPQYRAKPEDLLQLYVKNSNGEMVPFSTFVRMERVYGPEQLTRYNMYNCARINGTVAEGYSTGDAINTIREIAAQQLPRGYGFDWAGMTREEVKSGDQALYIFIISLVFVYLVLAAQYESFLLPLPVLLSLPAGIFGAWLALKVCGLQNNIYAQVALIMLIGLLGKNAILIVEFAIQKRNEGVSVPRAAVEGSVSRLRPILMTSFAFIAGLIPLCIATGAGAMGNRSIGTAAAGGMFIGTVFGVLVIPGLYVLFASLTERKKPASVANARPVPVSINNEIPKSSV
ncbi:MAG TPA: efflux RND transporter permease subunit, partial [Chryseosolibacter sp.]